MPQTTSAKKALRVSARNRVVNDRWRKQLRLSIRAVKDAIFAKDATAASAAFTKAQSMIDRARRHNILTTNAASRKKSRLLKEVQGIQ